MSKYCMFCGTAHEDNDVFCSGCGKALDAEDAVPSTPESDTVLPVVQETASCPEETPIPAESESEAQDDTPAPTTPAVKPKKAKKERKIKKEKKKRGKFFKFMKFLLILLCIFEVLLFCWITFGKWLTLHIHSNDVVAALNAGSLDFPGSHKSDYDELPDYAKEMLGENLKKEQENGPLMNAILPHLQVERVKIHWFGASAAVEYAISAPDVEQWLLSLNEEDMAKTPEALVEDLAAYINTAPRRESTVTVEYTRNSIFSVDWNGDYETVEFADAISGGVNSAYNVFYTQYLTELQEAAA